MSGDNSDRSVTEALSDHFLNPFGDITRTSHHLPHRHQDNVWQFVTWRLGDSLPKTRLDAWQREKFAWMARHPKPWSHETELEFHMRFSARIDHWLDAGHGSCVLRDASCRQIMTDTLRHFAEKRYSLDAYVVMPNHVHVLFHALKDWETETIVHSWKSFTANKINSAIGRRGALWQDDYWDRMIRNERHLEACCDYIADNPKRARLRAGEYELFLKEDVRKCITSAEP